MLLGIDPGMSDHDVSVEGDGQHSKDGHCQESVAHEREEGAKSFAMDPGPVIKEGRCER